MVCGYVILLSASEGESEKCLLHFSRKPSDANYVCNREVSGSRNVAESLNPHQNWANPDIVAPTGIFILISALLIHSIEQNPSC